MKYSIIIPILIFTLMGCKGDPGPAGPTLSGNISGSFILYDDNGSTPQDRSGVQISIEGHPFSTLTATNGSWQLEEVPAGIYTLVYSKTGYFTWKSFNFQFVGGGTYFFGNSGIAQIPLATITQFKLTGPDGFNNFHIQVNISSADTLPREIGIIFNETPIALSSTITYFYEIYAYLNPDSTSYSFDDPIFPNFIKQQHGLTTGTKVYTRAHTLPRDYFPTLNPITEYYEVYNGQNTFSSNLDSLIVP